jgi:hypothetical protein
MISCGERHSLALTESGRVFGWGDNDCGQLGDDIGNSSEPIIIELNDFKTKKISYGRIIIYCYHVVYSIQWHSQKVIVYLVWVVMNMGNQVRVTP